MTELYAVTDGTPDAVYQGVRIDPVDVVVADRGLYVDRLGLPSSWLVIGSTKGGGGPRLFVTLLEEQEESVEGVWSGDSHDGPIFKVFDSLCAMVATLADVAESHHVPFSSAWSELDDLEREREPNYRLRRSPESWCRTGSAAGAFVESTWSEQPNWPPIWRAGLRTSGERTVIREPPN